MPDTVVEWAPFRLGTDVTETDLLTASEAFQANFLKGRAGFLRREIVHVCDRNYVDIIHWASRQDAEAVLSEAESSPHCQAFFAIMDMNGAGAADGVTHYRSVATYD